MTRIVDSKRVREGYATVTVLTLADDQGQEHQREVVSFGEAVCVLPFDPVRRVCLVVRLPRAPLIWAGVEAELIEAPAGMIDPGETPEASARREAFEETGVVLGALERVATCWTSPGVVAERVHLFLAPYGPSDRRGAGGGLADEHESITVEELRLAELWRLADEGALQDMKTLTLALSLRANHPDLTAGVA
jgi:nudix-type nucleoside diphosphatase (YffH/AdpP family)